MEDRGSAMSMQTIYRPHIWLPHYYVHARYGNNARAFTHLYVSNVVMGLNKKEISPAFCCKSAYVAHYPCIRVVLIRFVQGNKFNIYMAKRRVDPTARIR